MIRKKRFSMIEPLAKSRSFERMISQLDKIIENTADYFDDELTAQLNITKAWLNDTRSSPFNIMNFNASN